MIKITSSALCQIRNILKRYSYNYIKFSVNGGGCNGFNYDLNPTNEEPNKNDEIIKINDVNVVLCEYSVFHIIGTEIDWKEDIMGSSFVFNNPNANSKCGCGNSFGI